MGACSPSKIFHFRRSEIDSGALLGKKCDFCMVKTESSFVSAGSLCS